MFRIFAAVFAICLLLPVCSYGEPVQINDRKARESYSLGYEFGQNLTKQEVEVDPDILVSAIRDGLDQKQPAIGQDEMRETVFKMRENVRAAQEKRAQETAAKTLEEGNAFLDNNKKNKDVKVLPSGLQYKVLVEGKGAGPKSTDTVSVNYRGTFVNGTEFDSSNKLGKPATLRVDGVIKGWTEALQLMKPGAKWEIFVPADLAYGARRFNRIPPNSSLIFEIELVSVAKADKSQPDAPGAVAEPRPAAKKK